MIKNNQGHGWQSHRNDRGALIPADILKILPYTLTIVVMIFVNAGKGRRFGGPAALGIPFSREG